MLGEWVSAPPWTGGAPGSPPAPCASLFCTRVAAPCPTSCPATSCPGFQPSALAAAALPGLVEEHPAKRNLHARVHTSTRFVVCVCAHICMHTKVKRLHACVTQVQRACTCTHSKTLCTCMCAHVAANGMGIMGVSGPPWPIAQLHQCHVVGPAHAACPPPSTPSTVIAHALLVCTSLGISLPPLRGAREQRGACSHTFPLCNGAWACTPSCALQSNGPRREPGGIGPAWGPAGNGQVGPGQS